MRSIAAGIALVCTTSCASSTAPDPGLEGLSISSLAPETIIPGTKLFVTGASFVDDEFGKASVHITGDANGQRVDARWPATFVDFSTMTIAIDAGKIDEVGGDVDFRGTARVDIVATSDGETYSSDVISLDLRFREKLTPVPVIPEPVSVIFTNDQIQVEGDGFLLGGDEGDTVAKVSGCFTPEAGGSCQPIAELEIPMQPMEKLSRTKSAFPFSPRIAGIKPGTFTGRVTVINRQMKQPEIAAAPIDVMYDMVTAQIFSIDPPAASFGQYVFIKGGGFVGGEATASTEIELSGTFTSANGNSGPVAVNVIPEFVEGRLSRYVLNTDDELGMSIDLRAVTGQFTGTATPLIRYDTELVRGVSRQVSLAIAPIKQVVHLQFQPTYVEGLRHFGLRAVEKKLRDRIISVCKRTYEGVNIEFRAEPPTDFALYSKVELSGSDPNGTGLFGYDNTPGKDNGNLRLYDQLGGVNAKTQQDGYPGYGGVFMLSLMGFSKHPAQGVKSVPGADPLFDKMFDPFRADQGGEPIRSADLSGNLTVLGDGTSCPARDRKGQIACAIYVMGNLIGGTLSHEIGHSLGLANPYSEGFHNPGDAENRLMDAGGDRPFVERAELAGHGPGVFCDEEYAYLRMVLPSMAPEPAVVRPGCF